MSEEIKKQLLEFIKRKRYGDFKYQIIDIDELIEKIEELFGK